MANEGIDYGAVLMDLEGKKAAIEAAIAGVRQMLNIHAEQGVSNGANPTPERKDQPIAVRFDTFFQMSLPAAITRYLEISKCPQSVSDITRSLLEGGFKTTSKNLMPIVGSNLSRMKSAGDVVNIDGKWGLASWYPAARMQSAVKPKGKNRGRPKAKPKATAASAPAAEPVTEQKPKWTPEQIERIRRLDSEGKTHGQIAKEVGIHHFSVKHILKQEKERAQA
jgi:hypothetical protein